MSRLFCLFAGGLAAVIIFSTILRPATVQSMNVQTIETPASPEYVKMSSASYSVPWDVIANGGGVLSSSHFSLYQTAGQSSFTTFTSANYQLHGGYWQWLFYYLFIPIVMR